MIEGQHRSLGLMRHANVIEIDDDYALTIYAAGHVPHVGYVHDVCKLCLTAATSPLISSRKSERFFLSLKTN